MGKAKAPRPGATERAEATAAATKTLVITIKRPIVVGKNQNRRELPEVHTLAPSLIPMRERIICRKATGLPFSAFWSEDRVDIDSMVVLWWMARRAHGEVTLTFDDAAEQWPADLDPDELDFTVDDGEGDEDDAPTEPEDLDDPEG